MPSLPGLVFTLLALLALSLATACEETSTQVHHAYLDRHRDAYVYEGADRARVIAPLRGLLAERGYELIEDRSTRASGANHETLHTRPRVRGAGATEYVVHVIPLRLRPAFVVQLVQITRDGDGEVVSSVRDDGLEWELIQRADPDGALEIIARANERADKVPPSRRH
jgi:hypothetical protein